MILDAIENLGLYASINPLFPQVIEFISKTDLSALEEGRYPIVGEDDAFALISERSLKAPADAAMEAHDTYIDIQIVIRGHEGFGWKDRAQCTTAQGEMDAQKDILFYTEPGSTYFELTAGQIAIFFPGDAHAPLVGEGEVKKCVVKVKA